MIYFAEMSGKVALATVTPQSGHIGVSVVMTVLNEALSVNQVLDSLAAQTRPPDEVVIVDGGSTDGTWEILEARSSGMLPVRLFRQEGANISHGRNLAIGHARGPIIAVTDAGVTLPPTWLERLVEPLTEARPLAAGFFVPDPQGPFETALGAVTLPRAADVDGGRFLPSSRSAAFLKRIWGASGGYPEWLDYCEDLVFDIRAQEAAGCPWTFVPGAAVQFRPRPNLSAFARQYYRYARGDGKADLWPARHAVRYGTYVVAGPILFALSLAGHATALAALAVGAFAMVAGSYRRLLEQWSDLETRERIAAVAWVPVIRVTGDLAKVAGYPVGRWWRWKSRPPAWRPVGA